MRAVIFSCIALLLALAPLKAAVVFIEPFPIDAQSWSHFSLDSFGHSGGVGNPAGSLFGTINNPNALLPTLAAFYAGSGASGGGFTGDYTDDNRNPAPLIGRPFSLQFDFMAADVIPGSLTLVLEGPSSTYFSFGFNLSGMSAGEWNTFAAPLEYSNWWFGGTESQFNAMLASVQSVEIQFNTLGSSAQTYYLDNVLLSTEIIDLTVIPEPLTGQLFAMLALCLCFYRRRRITK